MPMISLEIGFRNCTDKGFMCEIKAMLLVADKMAARTLFFVHSFVYLYCLYI